MTSIKARTGPAGTSGQRSTPAELVDALNGLFGKQTDGRAVHAKGIVLLGELIPSPMAATLSRAPHFSTAVPVTARFSNFTGFTDISDADPRANPRGLALKFHLPDGSETDLVTHSFNGFPAATADEFREFLMALAASGPGAAAPTRADQFLAAHPAARRFLEQQPPAPVSYATLAYFGVNSFELTNNHDEAVVGRYRIHPEAGIHYRQAEELAGADPNYLAADLRSRLAGGPIRFDFRVQLAEPGDRVDDPSTVWPDERPTVELGRIELRREVEDGHAAEHALLFLPGLLPDGIAPADPMITARNESYPISYDRRHGRPGA